MKTFVVLVEYELPDDGTISFDIAVRPLIDAIRELSPVPPSNVTAFVEESAARVISAARPTWGEPG